MRWSMVYLVGVLFSLCLEIYRLRSRSRAAIFLDAARDAYSTDASQRDRFSFGIISWIVFGSLIWPISLLLFEVVVPLFRRPIRRVFLRWLDRRAVTSDVWKNARDGMNVGLRATGEEIDR